MFAVISMLRTALMRAPLLVFTVEAIFDSASALGSVSNGITVRFHKRVRAMVDTEPLARSSAPERTAMLSSA